MQDAWRRLRVKVDLPDGRLHDFRHTTGTYAAQAGLNAFMVRDLLGHKTMAMTGHYVEKTTEPLRAAADAVSGRVAAAMSGQQEAEVVELKKTPA
jgi:integrase